MKKIKIKILITLLLIGFSTSCDIFRSSNFGDIFPFIKEENVEILAESLNNLTDRSENYAVLDSWIDKNWIDPKTVKSIKQEALIGNVKTIEGARKIAHSYLKFRDLIWNLFEFLYFGVQDLGFFEEDEANKMERIFWSYGPMDKSFRIDTFLEISSVKFRKSHIYTRSSLKMMTQAFLELKGISPWAGLNWYLDEDDYD